jgi:hypothetical protein
MNRTSAKPLSADPILYLALLMVVMLLGSMPLSLRYAASNPAVSAQMFTPAGATLLQAANRSIDF